MKKSLTTDVYMERYKKFFRPVGNNFIPYTVMQTQVHQDANFCL